MILKKAILIFILVAITIAVYGEEKITNFHASIEIAEDGKVTVEESITVTVEGVDIKRGIVRILPRFRINNKGEKVKMDWKILSVMRNNEEDKFKIDNNKDYQEIYIGSKERLLQAGTYTYTLTYESYGHVGFFDDYDELYWNVTGNEWTFPITKASASIRLPNSLSALNMACYTGRTGSTSSNCHSENRGNEIWFQTTSSLKAGEGLTIAVSFPRDTIARPAPPAANNVFWEQHKYLICSVSLLVLMGCFYFFTWRKVGKDPIKPVVIPLFNAPHGWSPAVIRLLFFKVYEDKCFTAALINMAVKGAIRIKRENKKYKLENAGNTSNLSIEEKAVYDELFKKEETVLVSDENHKIFSCAIKKISKSLKRTLKIKKYYNYNSIYMFLAFMLTVATYGVFIWFTGAGEAMKPLLLSSPFILLSLVCILYVVTQPESKKWIRFVLFLVGVGLLIPVYFLGFKQIFADNWLCGTFLLAILISFLVYLFIIPSYTELGIQAQADIEGFKMYLKTAEENRLNHLTPPERTPELFEKFLPYAVALDVENEWGGKFDSILQQAAYKPDWYNDTKPLKYALFARSLSRSLNSSVSYAQHAPNSGGSSGWSSGSGGGGFSGGGAGGGGGRGW